MTEREEREKGTRGTTEKGTEGRLNKERKKQSTRMGMRRRGKQEKGEG